MSALLSVRDALVTGLAADVRLAGVNVIAHGGDFELDSLKRYSVQAPALIVALLDFKATPEGGSVMADATWGMVALTRNAPASAEEDPIAGRAWTSVIALADKATRALYATFYGYSAGFTVSKPRSFGAMNEFTTALDKMGVGMWGLSWKQTIELADLPTEAVFDELNTVQTRYDLAPRPDGEDLGDVPEAEDLHTFLYTDGVDPDPDPPPDP